MKDSIVVAGFIATMLVGGYVFLQYLIATAGNAVFFTNGAY